MPLLRLLSRQGLYCRQCLPTNLRKPALSISIRTFHASHSQKSPIIPLPAILLGLLKSGKLVSFVSLSSKTSLTLLPHTFRRDKGKMVGKVLAGIPIAGLTLLVAVGLDQAPNTSRLRFVYLSEQEEQEEVEKAINELMEPMSALVANPDSHAVQWLQTIVNNLAKVSLDDVRDPVRCYDDPPIDSTEPSKDDPKYQVSLICDGNTLNAMCAGRYIIVYDLMMQAMDYDETKMAVILSHEMAHSIQRHFVETHGFASLLLMLGDITRGVFWMVTESFGPYVNQKINEAITGFIALESENTYNRPLEREADLVGLKFMAKAGYDPRAAIDVWTTMAEIEDRIKAFQQDQPTAATTTNQIGDSPQSVGAMMESLISIWFGSSHPPSQERVEYMRQHMDEAVALYEEAIRLNGEPTQFIWSLDQVDDSHTSYFWSLLYYFFPTNKE